MFIIIIGQPTRKPTNPSTAEAWLRCRAASDTNAS